MIHHDDCRFDILTAHFIECWEGHGLDWAWALIRANPEHDRYPPPATGCDKYCERCIPEDAREQTRACLADLDALPKHTGEARYLAPDQVAEHRAAGWEVEPALGHHGEAGYHLAVKPT